MKVNYQPVKYVFLFCLGVSKGGGLFSKSGISPHENSSNLEPVYMEVGDPR